MTSILTHHGVAPTLDATTFVAPTAVVIGDTVIGAETGIWFGCVVRGDVNEIRIGARTNIQDGTIVHVTGGGNGTYIGDEVTIGHAVMLHACTLEDRAFVGMAATIMDGVVVESNAMVAAGALVTPGKRVLSGQLWAGSPAKYRRDLTPEELADIPNSAERYVRLARTYRGVG